MSTVTTSLTVSPRAGHLGAEVTGVDLRRPLDGRAGRRGSGPCSTEHLVLFFPGQSIDDDQQTAFALGFGEPYVHPIGRASGSTGGCEHIVDDVDHPPFQDRWHTDVSWDETPPTYGTLRAIDLPSRGGDTIWASMYAAYDALSPTMQQVIEPLEAVTRWARRGRFISKAGPELVARTRRGLPRGGPPGRGRAPLHRPPLPEREPRVHRVDRRHDPDESARCSASSPSTPPTRTSRCATRGAVGRGRDLGRALHPALRGRRLPARASGDGPGRVGWPDGPPVPAAGEAGTSHDSGGQR